MSLEKDIETINASLKQVSEQIKAQADAADKEIKAHAKLSEETRANVDKMLTQQGELQARLQAAEQMVATLQTGGGGQDIATSVGAKIANDEGYLAWAGADGKDNGGKFRAAVTRDPASAGDLIVPQRVPGVKAPGLRRLTVYDLLNVVPTNSNAVQFVRETGYTNNAAPVRENPTNPKPESSITFEADNAPVVDVAHWIHVSRQVLRDAPALQAYIEGRLMYGLKLKREDQILNGSGVGLNMNGLVTQATAYSNPGVTVQAETRLDRLRLALLQVELAEAWADGIVINPIDWTAIELTKTEDNAYLFANPRGLETPALWGRNVVPTTAMSATDFLVGAFGGGLAAEIHDRMVTEILVATQDDRDFVKNMVKILAEDAMALTVYRPEAFVTGDFDGLDPTPASAS